MLKNGSIGYEVSSLQKLLGLPMTGIFDEATYQAVVAVQKQHNLIADGIAGPKTMTALKGDKKEIIKLLNMDDINRAADQLKVDAASVIAVHKVESLGTGFLPDGRAKILYERHIMYRQLEQSGFDAADYQQKFPAIVNKARGGYLGGAREYGRLGMASQLSVADALESCSWGAYQIMGFHWQALGFESVHVFVDQMQQGEGKQLDAFVGFIAADAKLHAALKAKKWADFAKIYNGPDYKDNFYDQKLAYAYDNAQANLH